MRLLGHAVTDLAILFCSFLVVYAISFQKQPISYSLVINPSSLFSIRSETGEISLTRTLDYESDQRRYLLMVRASEDSSSLSAAAEVGLKMASHQQQPLITHLWCIFTVNILKNISLKSNTVCILIENLKIKLEKTAGRRRNTPEGRQEQTGSKVITTWTQ